jgi:nucleoside permease NupC
LREKPEENELARFTGVLGLLTMLLLAWIFSTDRRAIRWRTVVWGLGLQITFAFLVLKSSVGQRVMTAAGSAVNKLLAYAFNGSSFVFGDLGAHNSKLQPSGPISSPFRCCRPSSLSRHSSRCSTTSASCS